MVEGLNDFPFEDALSTSNSGADTSSDVSFLNEFNVEPPVDVNPDQVDAPPASDPPQNIDVPPANADVPPVDPPAPTGDVAVDAVNKEEYERVLAEKAELEQKLGSMTQVELDEHSRVIYEHIKSGDLKALKEYLDIQTTDFSAVAKEDLVRDYLRAKNPRWTEDDINDEMSQRFGIGLDQDLLTEQEMRRYNRELLANADEALNYFESKKSEIKLPDLTPKPAEPAISAEELERQQAEQVKQWEDSVTESLKDFGKLNVSIMDGEQLEFAIENAEELIQDVKALGKDVSVFFKPYIKEGKVDARKLAEDMAFLKNKESIVRAAVVKQIAKEKEEWIKGIKNTQLNPSDRSVQPEQRDILESFVDKW